MPTILTWRRWTISEVNKDDQRCQASKGSSTAFNVGVIGMVLKAKLFDACGTIRYLIYMYVVALDRMVLLFFHTCVKMIRV